MKITADGVELENLTARLRNEEWKNLMESRKIAERCFHSLAQWYDDRDDQRALRETFIAWALRVTYMTGATVESPEYGEIHVAAWQTDDDIEEDDPNG